MHVHVESDGHGRLSLDDELLAASARYFKADNERAPTVEQVAAYYRERHFAAVVFTVDATTATGHPGLSSEEIADRAAAHADVLIPFGSVDPLAGEQAVRRARRLISDHGVRGFKFHPSLQGFSPDDQKYYPLLTPERWLRDFELLEVKPEVRPKILKHNAARLLGLAG